MSEILSHRKKPEEVELENKKRELSALERELVELELDLANLHAELTAFQSLYMKVVGVLYAELDSIHAEIAEHISKSCPSDEKARTNAEQARMKAEASTADYQGTVALGARQFDPSQNLKSLYREVAKRVHPDLAGDPQDRARRQRFMADANRAYELGDETRLRAILEEYESSPESVFGGGVAAELVRVIRKIAQVKRRIEEIALEYEQIARLDLHVLKGKVSDAAKEGRDLLHEMAESVKLEIESARQHLANQGKGV